MAGKNLIIDPSTIDLDCVVADIEEIRQYNPQRFEMEQLTAIVHYDHEACICVGYKDVTRDEFWIRGHMPGMPLMPGVVMCEAAAQLASFYTLRFNLLESKLVGLGGLEDVRFRDPVIPGDRLVIAVQRMKVRPKRMIICRFQGFVRDLLVVEGTIKGVPLPEVMPGASPKTE
jgi:3-hydroxyacyl-[acyl-carrier-protein] dehydratase